MSEGEISDVNCCTGEGFDILECCAGLMGS